MAVLPIALTNPGAEAGTGTTDASTVAIPGWTPTGSPSAVIYGSPGGYPTAGGPGPPSRGSNFFTGGLVALSTLTQSLSFAGYETDVDAGEVSFALAAYLGGYGSDGDQATIALVFIDGAAAVLATTTLGPVTPGDRGNVTGLLLRSVAGSVPAGSRTVDVVMTMTRVGGGSDNDSYLDELDLVFSTDPPPPLPSWDGYLVDLIGSFSTGTMALAPAHVSHAVDAYALEEICVHPVAVPAIEGLDPSVPLGPLDYRAQAKSRVIIQYRQSTRLLGFIYALMDFCQEIDNVLLQIEPLDDIDLANDRNLTVTGELVGQLRELVNGDVALDPQLRILIKARITRNAAKATGPDILAILSQVFAAPIILTDYGGMAIGYAIGRVVTPDEAAVFNSGIGGTILARPMGVFVTQQFFDAGGDFFGFDDTPGSKTFGELNLAAPPGGPFSEIF